MGREGNGEPRARGRGKVAGFKRVHAEKWTLLQRLWGGTGGSTVDNGERADVGTADAKALRWQWLGVFQNLQRGQSDWSGEGGSNRPGAQRSEAGGYHTKQGLPGTLGFHSWYRRKALEDSVPKGTRSD